MASALIISDLENIDLTGLTYGQGTGCGNINYVAFVFSNYSGAYRYGLRKGVDKTGCSFEDVSGGESHPLMMGLFAPWGCNVLAGDYVTITFDGGQTLNVFLPAMTTNENLYIANDGSTYYDEGLTQLAQSSTAPPSEGFATITSFSADKSSAYQGEDITLSFGLKNNGSVTDSLFANIIDVDTGIVVQEYQIQLSAGATTVRFASFIMPNKTWNLRLEAGHVEPTPEPLMMSDVSNIYLNFSPTGGFYIIMTLGGTNLGLCDKDSNYSDWSSVTEQQIKLRLQNAPAITAGSSLVVEYDSNTLTIYLPDYGGGTIEIYPSTDGSTYYDSGLTQLAYKAP